MSYKFSELVLDDEKNLSVVFRDAAGHEIIQGMRQFLTYIPFKDSIPYLPPFECRRAAAEIISEGYEYFPAHA